MKTTKILSVLLFAILFAAANSIYAGMPGKAGSRINSANIVRYQVNVHMASDEEFCGTYQVMLVSSNGQFVALPQIFVPGITTYTFIAEAQANPQLYARGWKPKVTAMLVNSGLQDNLCTTGLVTIPASKVGPFLGGQTYSFDLFPNRKLNKSSAILKGQDL